MKTGFLGAGSMGGAVLAAMVRGGVEKAEDVLVCRRHPEKGTAGLPEGVRLTDAHTLARECGRIFLAVKPQQAEALLRELSGELAGRFVLSVMAGWGFDRLKAALPEDARVLCVMPNTPLSAGEGITLFGERTDAAPEELEWARRVFRSGGLVETVPEACFDAANAISGCGPAFASLFMEALADGAVRFGVPRDMAYRLAGQLLVGSGKLLLETGRHPGQLKDAVCSPGGSTIAGVRELERGAFRATVMEAVAATILRTREMAEGK